MSEDIIAVLRSRLHQLKLIACSFVFGGALIAGWFLYLDMLGSSGGTVVDSLVMKTSLEGLSFSALKQDRYSGETDLICRADVESSELEMIFEKHPAINRLHGDSFDRLLRRSASFITIGDDDIGSAKCYHGLLKPGVWLEGVVAGDENVIFLSRM